MKWVRSRLKSMLVKLLQRHRALCAEVLRTQGHPTIIDYQFKCTQRYGYRKPSNPFLYAILNHLRDNYQQALEDIVKYRDSFFAIPLKADAGSMQPYWDNSWLPALDAMALYMFLCEFKPRRYLEVGSGHSTKFTRKAIVDNNLTTKIISIDPYPRAEIDALCDVRICQPLEDIDLTIFKELEPGDLLFFDTSHCCFMNSDVTVFFLEVLPSLRSGVLVQIHDIFLPDDYPPGWEGKYLSEQYLLAVHLLANSTKFRVVLPNYFISNDPELNRVLAPIWQSPTFQGLKGHWHNPLKAEDAQYGSSFWFMIN